MSSKKCPNCGACKECGAHPPQLVPMPYPVPYVPYRPPSFPSYPGTNPYPFGRRWTMGSLSAPDQQTYNH